MEPFSAVAEPLTELSPLNQLVDMGGPIMVVLIALAVIGTVTFVYLMLYGSFYAPRYTRKLRTLVDQWQSAPSDTRPEQVRQQAGFFGRGNPLMHLLVNTMNACQTNPNTPAVRETAVRDAQGALEPFEAPLKIIEVIAALAPLLGLLGTVMGMMEAFSAMATTEGRASASQLSGGIYEALTTTAAGLVIAIPFAAIAAWCEFRLRRLNSQMNERLLGILNSAPAKTMANAARGTARTNDSARQDTYQPARVAHAAG